MLTNPNPITTEPVAAKTFDKLHLYSLTAIQPTGDSDSGSITVELLPATADGELATGDNVQRVSCPLYPAINEVPELAAAFAAVIAAIAATQAWLAAEQPRLWTMSNAVTLTEEQAKLVMQALDLAVKTGGLNAAAAILPVAQAIEGQLTKEETALE
jgi:hypothetical protein